MSHTQTVSVITPGRDHEFPDAHWLVMSGGGLQVRSGEGADEKVVAYFREEAWLAVIGTPET